MSKADALFCAEGYDSGRMTVANAENLEILKQGPTAWNQWRDKRRASLSTICGQSVKVDLSGANLFGLDLFNADLSGCDLTGADLIDADLRKADLGDSNIRGAFLVGTDLRDARLFGIQGWRKTGSMLFTNIADVVGAPDGFYEHARLCGAVDMRGDQWLALRHALLSGDRPEIEKLLGPAANNRCVRDYLDLP